MNQNVKETSEKNPITVKKAAQEWLLGKRLFIKPSTYAKYTHSLQRHILPYLGETDLNEIEAGTVNLFLKMLLEEGRVDKTGGLSPKTVHDIYIMVRAISRFARETYHTSDRTARASKLWRRDDRIAVMDTLSRTKLETYLLENSKNPRCAGILLCLYTGIRLGEICALRWSGIHLDEGYIRISSTIQRIQNVDFGVGPRTKIICSPPKSRNSVREIPLPGFLLEILRAARPESDINFFFLTGSGDFIEPRTYQNHFKRYLKINEIPDIHFHALRHTFATRCVAAGVDVKSLSEILGHSSVQMTLNYYVHPSLEDKRRQIERIGPEV